MKKYLTLLVALSCTVVDNKASDQAAKRPRLNVAERGSFRKPATTKDEQDTTDLDSFLKELDKKLAAPQNDQKNAGKSCTPASSKSSHTSQENSSDENSSRMSLDKLARRAQDLPITKEASAITDIESTKESNYFKAPTDGNIATDFLFTE